MGLPTEPFGACKYRQRTEALRSPLETCVRLSTVQTILSIRLQTPWRFAVRSFMMNSTPTSPRILSRDFNFTFRGRLTLQRRASAVQFLPSTPQKLPICQLKAPKAPELHTKAKGPSRANTFSEGAHT